VLAVDFSEIALARARRRCNWSNRVSFSRLNLRADPLPQEFELVVVMDVLNYFTRGEVRRHIRDKLVASIGEGGYLLVGDGHGDIQVGPLYQNEWWARPIVRGAKWQLETFARHQRLETLGERSNETHRYGLFRKVPAISF
jgi:hypothetical protein